MREEEAGADMTKALSIRQPWAALIVLGKKSIEIRRGWAGAPTHRGDLLIHAGKTVDKNVPIEADFAWCDQEVYRVSQRTGGIIGKVSMIDVVEYGTYQQFAADVELHRNPADWWRPGLMGFVFADPEFYTRTYFLRGQLGLFDVDLEAVIAENRAYRERMGRR